MLHRTVILRGLAALLFLLLLSSCGGGSSTPPPPPPPPPPDFSLSVSSDTVGVPAGGTTPAITLTVNPLNGFSGAVTINLENLPPDVTLSPSAPFSLSAGQSTDITFTAAGSAIPGNAIVTVRGNAGALMRSTTIDFNILATLNTRSRFQRFGYKVYDSVYDPLRKRVFVTAWKANRVHVFSSIDGTLLASIPVPDPFGIDITPNGDKVYVATLSNIIIDIDPNLLQIRDRIEFIAEFFKIPGLRVFAEIPVVTLNGNILLSTRSEATPTASIIRWNPATNTKTTILPFGFDPIVVFRMTRSADFSRVLIGDNLARLAVYDAATDSFLNSLFLTERILGMGINFDGSKIVVSGDRDTVFFYDGSLNLLGSVSVPGGGGSVVFSNDDQRVYISGGQVTVIDTQSLEILGGVPPFPGVFPFVTEPGSIDETDYLFSPSGGGMAFLDVSSPQPLTGLPPSALSLRPPHGNPDELTPTSVTVSQIRDGVEVFFGNVSGLNTSQSNTSVFTTAPPSAKTGSVDVTFSFPDGWKAGRVEGFTYGPDIRHLTADSGPPEGGTELKLFGKGFSPDTSPLTVTIGDRAVEISHVSIGLGNDPDLREIILSTPPGTPGPADVRIETRDGIFTMPGGFHYLDRMETFPVTGQINQMVYDESRQLIFLTNSTENRVEVFSLTTRQFMAPIPVGESPARLALAVDKGTVIVTNAADSTVSLIDPASLTVKDTIQVSDPADTSIFPWNVAALAGNRAFVELRFAGSGSGGRLAEINLLTNAVKLRQEVCDPLRPTICRVDDNILVATADGDMALSINTNISSGDAFTWHSATDTFRFHSLGSVIDGSISADGNLISVEVPDNPPQARILNPELMLIGKPFPELGLREVDIRRVLPGQKLHPTGALLYVPVKNILKKPVLGDTEIATIDIYDVHERGLRRRIPLPDGFAVAGADPLALDEFGKRIFINTGSGLTVVEMATVPLGVGSVTPSEGSSAGGTTVKIRGSGFQDGAVVKFGDAELITQFIDENTLQVTTPSLPAGAVRVTIVNPDGEEYSLDAGFKFTN